MLVNDNFYMKLAIDEAWKYQLLTYPNPAVGAVVVKNGELLSIEAHQCAGESHAEVNALKSAYLKKHQDDRLNIMKDPFLIHKYLIKNHNYFFTDCVLYVTLEPCNHLGKTPSCTDLIKKLQLNKVVIGHLDINPQAKGGIASLKMSNINLELNCMNKEAYDLLYPFVKWSRGTFIFYKMAQTLNGTIDGGKISSNQTLAYVHTLREKINLLVIGGNSVRIDRPTLDARYINGYAPDVLIYSKNKIFDKNIPLFKVPNRDVMISDDLFKLLDYNFVMIEGGYNLLQILESKIDYILLLISPKIKNGLNSEEISIHFQIIHENYIGEDKLLFLKRI